MTAVTFIGGPVDGAEDQTAQIVPSVMFIAGWEYRLCRFRCRAKEDGAEATYRCQPIEKERV